MKSPAVPTDAVRETIGKYLEQVAADAPHVRDVRAFLNDPCGSLVDRRNMRGHVTASGWVLNEAGNRTLLIFHRGLGRWLQPGGHVDAGETLVQAAEREVREELGLIAQGDVLRVHPWHGEWGIPFDLDSHRIPANPKKGEAAHMHHDVLYLFVLPEGQDLAGLAEDEVGGAKWFELDAAAGLGREHGEERMGRVVQRLRGDGFGRGG